MNNDLPEYGAAFDVKCPNCGRAEGTFSRNDYRYGSPLRVCKKCGHKYINPFYHEIAIEGTAPDAFSIKAKLKAFALMASIFLVAFAFHFYEITFSSYYHTAPIAIMIGTGVGMLISAADIITIKSGYKAKRTGKKRLESEERLRNADYARELAELGYDVPAEYLGESAAEVGKEINQ